MKWFRQKMWTKCTLRSENMLSQCHKNTRAIKVCHASNVYYSKIQMILWLGAPFTSHWYYIYKYRYMQTQKIFKHEQGSFSSKRHPLSVMKNVNRSLWSEHIHHHEILQISPKSHDHQEEISRSQEAEKVVLFLYLFFLSSLFQWYCVTDETTLKV